MNRREERGEKKNYGVHGEKTEGGLRTIYPENYNEEKPHTSDGVKTKIKERNGRSARGERVSACVPTLRAIHPSIFFFFLSFPPPLQHNALYSVARVVQVWDKKETKNLGATPKK